MSVLLWPGLVGFVVSFAAFLAYWQARHFRAFFGRTFAGWCALTPFGRAVAVLALCIAVLFGGGKTNQVMFALAPPRPPSVVVPASAYIDHAVSNETVLAEDWWRRGAYDDWRRIDFADGWVFPCGTDHLDRVSILSRGEIRTALRDTNDVARLPLHLSMKPYGSSFTAARTPSNSYLFCWSDCFVRGETNATHDARVELFRNGDVSVLVDGVETFTPRELPFAHDGYGQDAAWVRANVAKMQGLVPALTNADEVLSVGYANWVDEQVGVGLTNGLYKLTATVLEVPPETLELKVGDWSVAVTNAGEYVFLLEKGVDYDFGTVPYFDGIDYEMCDDLLPIVGGGAPLMMAAGAPSYDVNGEWRIDGGWCDLWYPTREYFGRCSWWPTLLAGPDVNWFDESLPKAADFWAHLYDGRPWMNAQYHWSGSANVTIDTPDAQTTTATLGGVSGFDYCWLDVTTRVGGYDLTSSIWCRVRTNETPRAHFTLEGPDSVFVHGELRPLTIGVVPFDGDVDGTLSLSCPIGYTRVQLWEDADRTIGGNELEWDAGTFDRKTFWVEGIGESQGRGDVLFELNYVPDEGEAECVTKRMTCLKVSRIDVSGVSENGSSNPPPFLGHTPYVFDVTHSPRPDKHHVVFFSDVIDSNFAIMDFSVRVVLRITPSGCEDLVGDVQWLRLPPTPNSGLLVPEFPCSARLENPKVGGVYHIASVVGGAPTNECNIVLPLAGASMDEVLARDIIRADDFVTKVMAKYGPLERNRLRFGLRWFVKGGNGDYIGRPDNAATPTVWFYNQVNDTSGMGAIGTLAGQPIRIAKLSNFIVGYACERLGVLRRSREISQYIGTRNDKSATLSWDFGEYVAKGSNWVVMTSRLVREAWSAEDEKLMRLWPNLSAVDNHAVTNTYHDVNRRFYSAGFLYQTP